VSPCGRQSRFRTPAGSTRFFSSVAICSASDPWPVERGTPGGGLISYSRLVPPAMSMPGLRLSFSLNDVLVLKTRERLKIPSLSPGIPKSPISSTTMMSVTRPA